MIRFHLQRHKNIKGLAARIRKKHPVGKGYFRACMNDSVTKRYPNRVRASICAKVHKLAIGKWPGEKKHKANEDKKKKKYKLRSVAQLLKKLRRDALRNPEK